MLPREKTPELLRHVIKKLRVELVVEKAVDLEYPAGLDLPVGKYALLQKLHDGYPPEYEYMAVSGF